MQYHDIKQIEGMIRYYGVTAIRKEMQSMWTIQMEYHDRKELESLIAFYGLTAVRKQITAIQKNQIV